MSKIQEVPVIIIGGGGCGLTLSSLLSDYHVEHLLFERHDATSRLPKAHYLNQRSMEVLRQHHMESEILEKGSPLWNMSQVAWQSSLGGDGPLDRKVIHKFTSFGGDDGSAKAESYRRDAPLRSCNLPQIRLEPLLKKIAESRNPGNVRFSHNVVDFVDEGDSVLVTVEANGQQTQYRAQFLVGADGGKLVNEKIGAVLEGPSGIADMVSTHFSADLSEYWDDRYFACHFINGSGGTVLESGAMVPMGPTWGRHSEQWSVHFGFSMDDEKRHEEEAIVPRIRELLKLPDLKMDVHKISHWNLERVLASKFQKGRVFIAGDAAHRHPPTTGLGLNTAIEDANNLAWKLTAVTKGLADKSLLDTYETERRYAGKRNCDWGLFTFANTVVINAAVGLIKGQPEANKLRFQALWEDSESGRTFRAQVQRIIDSQVVEFSAHDLELGFRYPSGAIIPDGVDAPPVDPLGQIYTANTGPGNRLPHVWLNDGKKVISTHDLIASDSTFLIITDESGAAWLEAAKKVAKSNNIKISTAVISSSNRNGTFRDREERWEKLKGIKEGGAILVRPDNFVAARWQKPSKEAEKEVAGAVATLLGKSSEELGRIDSHSGTNGVH
ncbi:uncharacterized protein BDZ99DRAFT_463196 [Mytilinidion resinicola]|uniref:FAD-binding domain-containing protein n=1 Tax=Mytilinidion resinicola TaxID=574789 RepID=A0A6A6YKN7_9PEZI|nr:uncharacterized protein BDZ99DRAFT_463196 [Mytilinidion resinicola]KAF2809360.1 hypothetical protein BDZ99DRAFT_463196 [Mytilinidion resinicola]